MDAMFEFIRRYWLRILFIILEVDLFVYFFSGFFDRIDG